MTTTIGIDLGTTNSCVALVEGGRASVIANAEGERTTPSVVAFGKDGQRLVGTVAMRQAATNPHRTFASVKRHMGTDWRAALDDKRYTAQELSAMILRKLRQDAEAYVGHDIVDAVITVPAYFNDMQRQATKDAGRIAGLNVLRIINEPTAAALAYGLDNGGAQKVMVYDLGGGTFDVSVIEIGDGVIEVLATAGDNHLGGDDFDERIVDYLADGFLREHGVDVRRDPAAHERIREAAATAKKELSSIESTTVNLPFLAQGSTGPLHMETVLTRSAFENMTRDLVERTTGPVHQALSDAGIAASELGQVLLVGGSTRIPAVQAHVRSLTGKEPSSSINPGMRGAGSRHPRRYAFGRKGGARYARRRDTAARRDAAQPLHRNDRRRSHAHHRAQHHPAGPSFPGVHHRGGVSDQGRSPRAPGRASHGSR